MATPNNVTPTNCSWWPISALENDAGKGKDGEENQDPTDPALKAQDRLVLYHWTQSFSSQKVRLVIAEKGLPCEERDVSMPLLEHKEPWFMRLNLGEEVPVIIHRDNIISDYNQIIDYMEKNFTGAAQLGHSAGGLQSQAGSFGCSITTLAPASITLATETSKPSQNSSPSEGALPASAAVLSRPHRAAQQRNGASPPWGQMDGHPKSHGGALASSGSQEGAAPHPGGPEVHCPMGPQSPHHSVPSPGCCEEQVTRHLLAACCPSRGGTSANAEAGNSSEHGGDLWPCQGMLCSFLGGRAAISPCSSSREPAQVPGRLLLLLPLPSKTQQVFFFRSWQQNLSAVT
ncbi:ganglioside-induced differentiation-associated protein 1-like 1 isoform X2 [Anas acuta]|uniref:ganglioside-induced differentiation-associated protein 1-like 1 isoform X2 n=1 Tax=Anas acuta TaxID=28680 RepID=UPI0035C8A153